MFESFGIGEFFAVNFIASLIIGLIMHHRNRLHHRHSPLITLIVFCILVNTIATSGALVAIAGYFPTVEPLAISPVAAALGALAAPVILNEAIYGFHWEPEP